MTAWWAARSRRSQVILVTVGLAILYAMVGPTSSRAAPGTSTAPKSSSGSAVVQLISGSCEHTTTTVQCDGQVKNVSSVSLNGVRAVVVWYDDAGVDRRHDAGELDYAPFLPDQVSPWHVTAAYNPGLTKYSVRFEWQGNILKTPAP